MKVNIIIPLIFAASCVSGFAATGMSGSYDDIFTTTRITHLGGASSSQGGFYGQNLGTINVPTSPENKGDGSSSKSNFILVPEPASAFLGIIGLALLLLRRK